MLTVFLILATAFSVFSLVFALKKHNTLLILPSVCNIFMYIFAFTGIFASGEDWGRLLPGILAYGSAVIVNITATIISAVQFIKHRKESDSQNTKIFFISMILFDLIFFLHIVIGLNS